MLGMYDFPEIQAIVDELYELIRWNFTEITETSNIKLSQSLTRGTDTMSIWLDPDLGLAQTCGYPYNQYLKEKTILLGTPDYHHEFCPNMPKSHYCSYIITHQDTKEIDYRHCCFAVNGLDSESGHHALKRYLGYSDFTKIISDSHRQSIIAVATKKVDAAAIDSVTFEIISAFEPHIAEVKIIDQTPFMYGLPLITSLGMKPHKTALINAIIQAIEKSPSIIQEKLKLKGFTLTDKNDYRVFT